MLGPSQTAEPPYPAFLRCCTCLSPQLHKHADGVCRKGNLHCDYYCECGRIAALPASASWCQLSSAGLLGSRSRWGAVPGPAPCATFAWDVAFAWGACFAGDLPPLGLGCCLHRWLPFAGSVEVCSSLCHICPRHVCCRRICRGSVGWDRCTPLCVSAVWCRFMQLPPLV